LASETE